MFGAVGRGGEESMVAELSGIEVEEESMAVELTGIEDVVSKGKVRVGELMLVGCSIVRSWLV